MVAQEQARRAGFDTVRSEHVLLAIVDLGGVGGSALKRLGVSADAIRAELDRLDSAAVGAGLRQALRAAEASARDEKIGTEHLLVGLIAAPGEGHAATVLSSLGVSADDAPARALRYALDDVRAQARAQERHPASITARACALVRLYRSWRRSGHGRRVSLWAADIVLFPGARLNRLYLAKPLHDWRLTSSVYRSHRECGTGRRAALWSAACAVSISPNLADDFPPRAWRRLRRMRSA